MFEFWVRVEPNYSYPLKEFSLEKSEGFQSLFFFLNKPKYPNKKYSRQAVVVGIILTYSFSCSKKGGVATGCL